MFERVYAKSKWYRPMLSEGPIASVAIHAAACIALLGSGASPAAVARQVNEAIIFLAPLPSGSAGPSVVAEALRYVDLGSAVMAMADNDSELHVGLKLGDRSPQPEGAAIAPPAESFTSTFERPADSVYFAEQVDSPAAYDERSAAPAYPDSLQRAGIDGSVMARFVIDTTGHVEIATVTVLESTNKQFTESVLAALPRMLFRPAVLNGRKARQVVEVPFKFRVVAIKDTAQTRDSSWARPPR
jgi:TonB family protein